MELEITRDGVVVPTRADPSGRRGPTPGQARGPRFRTAAPGWFLDAAVDHSSADQRIVEAIVGMPDGSAITGWAALHWQGARWFDGRDGRGAPSPVPVAIDDRAALRARDGVELCHGWLFHDDVLLVDGVPVTRPERSVFNAVAHSLWFDEGVRVASMACAADLTSLAELAAYNRRLSPRPYTRRFAQVIELADENLWSPMEAVMLLRWLERGHPRPLCNAPVFDLQGRHLLTPDLLDPRSGVLAQYDGAVHDLRQVRRRDLTLEERCRELGLEVVTMISTDLPDVRSFGLRLDAAYRRAGASTGDRRWTTTPPPWWVDTSTVAGRRALDEEQRHRWLRYRAG